MLVWRRGDVCDSLQGITNKDLLALLLLLWFLYLVKMFCITMSSEGVSSCFLAESPHKHLMETWIISFCLRERSSFSGYMRLWCFIAKTKRSARSLDTGSSLFRCWSQRRVRGWDCYQGRAEQTWDSPTAPPESHPCGETGFTASTCM